MGNCGYWRELQHHRELIFCASAPKSGERGLSQALQRAVSGKDQFLHTTSAARTLRAVQFGSIHACLDLQTTLCYT